MESHIIKAENFPLFSFSDITSNLSQKQCYLHILPVKKQNKIFFASEIDQELYLSIFVISAQIKLPMNLITTSLLGLACRDEYT